MCTGLARRDGKRLNRYRAEPGEGVQEHPIYKSVKSPAMEEILTFEQEKAMSQMATAK